MAKGDYRSKYGGSRSGYEKGVKDTLKIVGSILLSVSTVVVGILMAKKK
jgi:hypothetical protein